MNEMITLPALPYNLEAERSVLGAILLHNEALESARELIDASDFYSAANAAIFTIMVQLGNRGEPIDLLTLREVLDQNPAAFREAGGPAYVCALVDGVPRATAVVHYARIVKEKATLRNLIASADMILRTAYESNGDK